MLTKLPFDAMSIIFAILASFRLQALLRCTSVELRDLFPSFANVSSLKMHIDLLKEYKALPEPHAALKHLDLTIVGDSLEETAQFIDIAPECETLRMEGETPPVFEPRLVQIPPLFVTSIMDHGKLLTKLVFADVDLTNFALNLIERLPAQLPQLQHFTARNVIRSSRFACQIIKAAVGHKSLQTLDVSQNASMLSNTQFLAIEQCILSNAPLRVILSKPHQFAQFPTQAQLLLATAIIDEANGDRVCQNGLNGFVGTDIPDTTADW
jgi:hypothetical protein